MLKRALQVDWPEGSRTNGGTVQEKEWTKGWESDVAISIVCVLPLIITNTNSVAQDSHSAVFYPHVFAKGKDLCVQFLKKRPKRFWQGAVLMFIIMYGRVKQGKSHHQPGKTEEGRWGHQASSALLWTQHFPIASNNEQIVQLFLIQYRGKHGWPSCQEAASLQRHLRTVADIFRVIRAPSEFSVQGVFCFVFSIQKLEIILKLWKHKSIHNKSYWSIVGFDPGWRWARFSIQCLSAVFDSWPPLTPRVFFFFAPSLVCLLFKWMERDGGERDRRSASWSSAYCS